MIFKLPPDLGKKKIAIILGCWNSIYCYLHGRSMRISNFQGIKKNAESKHSPVTVIDSLTQFAKQLGTLGPVNVITMSAECLWRWSKSEQNHKTCWKAARTISSYLKPGGKETLSLKPVRGRVISQPWSQGQNSKSKFAQNPQKTLHASALHPCLPLPAPPLPQKQKHNSQSSKGLQITASKALIVQMGRLRHKRKDLASSIQTVVRTVVFFRIPWTLNKNKNKIKQNRKLPWGSVRKSGN